MPGPDKEKTLDVKVDTLRDKLYLFQFTPAQTTELHYTNGEGEEVTLTSNENGELAVYDETGIASDVTLKSGSEEEPYLGTIYQEDTGIHGGQRRLQRAVSGQPVPAAPGCSSGALSEG